MKLKKYLSFVLAFIILLSHSTVLVAADDRSVEIDGKVYEVENKSEFSINDVSSFSPTSEYSNKMGELTLSGEIINQTDSNGINVFTVDSSNSSFNIQFHYSKDIFNLPEDKWHLDNDNSKTVNGIKLDKAVKSGTIIVQSSKDGQKWNTDTTISDIFADKDNNTVTIYSPNDVQIMNGTYFRIFLAYKLRINTGKSKIVLWEKNNWDYKQVITVYDFYIHDIQTENIVLDNTTIHYIGVNSLVNAGKDTGYSKEDKITEKDPHYGWKIGNFYFTGFSDAYGDDSSVTLLKNVGDKVVFCFELLEDINRLNGKDKLQIVDDTNGYDEYFQTQKSNTKKGVLIIRYTSPDGKTQEPQQYIDFFAGSNLTTANTNVMLFEEGDYEVALDYEIKDSSPLIGHEIYNYRMSFSFKVRNSNTKVLRGMYMGKFKIPTTPPTVNKTIRFPTNVVEEVEAVIQGKDCTFSGFVIAAVRAALDDLDKDAK